MPAPFELPAPLFAVVALAFAAEALTGFGGTVITVTLGAQFLPLDALLPLYVPVNLLLSLWISVRDRGHVSQALLTRTMLPAIGAGMVVGLVVYRVAPPGPWLVLAYAVLVAVLAALELVRGSSAKAPSPVAHWAGLVGGGVVHGLYGSGGPLIVWATSRQLQDKSALRATLSALWLVLGTVLVAQYASLGQLDGRTLRGSAALLPCLVLGKWIGHSAHQRIAPEPFRRLLHWLLLGAALSLLVRKAMAVSGH
ncbi:MAG: TSUP family transporter [Deltaproteobacteria bacterium]|nr:TSUP family transporter [Deltaproteobacteria bacterium]